MAKEEFTVLFDVQDAAMAPLVFAEGKVRVLNAAGSELKKALGVPIRASGSVVKTAEPQECKLVTVEAESAEEACLMVKKYYGLGGQVAVENKQLENITPNATETTATGPNVLGGLVPGKWAAAVLTEVTVK